MRHNAWADYENDAAFRRLVDTLYYALHDCTYSVGEVRQAVTLATERIAMERPTTLFEFPELDAAREAAARARIEEALPHSTTDRCCSCGRRFKASRICGECVKQRAGKGR